MVFFLNLMRCDQMVYNGEGHIRTDGAGSVAEQQGSVHHFPYLAALNDDGGLYALAHRDKIMVNGADCEERRYGSMLAVDVAVGEDDVVDTLVHALLCLLAQIVESAAQTAFAFLHLEEHGQLHGVESLVADIAKQVEFGIGEHGLRQTHHLAVALVGSKYSATHTSYIFGKRHHQFLTYRVDGRIGDLRKLLTEIVEQQLRTLAQYGERRVVAHGSHRLLSICTHRYDGAFDVFFSEAESAQLRIVVGYGVGYLATALEVLQLNASGRKPLAVRMLVSQLVLYLAVVIYPAFLGVDKQNLAWLETSLADHIRRFEVHHAYLACHHHHAALGYRVARRAQTVAVEHTACVPAVREHKRCRSVPWFHQDGVILVESLEVFRYRILVVERFGHKDSHGLRQTHAAHYKELEHVVERGGVAHVFLDDGQDVLDVAQSARTEHALSCLHPRTVAAYGVYLAVVAEQAEGLSQFPFREGIG